MSRRWIVWYVKPFQVNPIKWPTGTSDGCNILYLVLYLSNLQLNNGSFAFYMLCKYSFKRKMERFLQSLKTFLITRILEKCFFMLNFLTFSLEKVKLWYYFIMSTENFCFLKEVVSF